MTDKNLIQIALLGDTTTGKTTLINYYKELGFTENIPTIGIDFFCKEITTTNDIKYILKIYDTAGQEQYHSMALNILKKCQGIILVYAINNDQSFENITNNWIKKIKESIDISKISVILIGNKIDLKYDRIISYEDGNNFAKDNNFLFLETSAKTGENISDVFQKLFDNIVNNFENNKTEENNFTLKELKEKENAKITKKGKKC